MAGGESAMSGGASIPTAPNLSANSNAANAIAGTASSDAAQTLNTAQSYNANAQKNLSNVVNQSNSMAGQIGNQATQNMSTYGSSFVPLQAQQAQQAQQYGSAANVQKLQGQAVANSNAANQASLTNSQQALAAEGVDPASIQGQALNRQASTTGAANVAGAATQSGINTTNTAIALTNQANQLGMQIGAQGTAGSATAAGVSQAGQQVENQTNSSGVQNLTAANQYLNTDVNANQSAANIQNTQFGDQLASANAQNAQSAGEMAAVGSIVGGAAKFMEKGGPVPALPTGHAGPYVPVQIGRHAGLPVNARHFQPTSALSFRSMDAGGPVTAQGALPVGSIPGTTDRQPAMLTPGEFVLPHDVVQHLGTEKLHKMIDSTRQKANMRRAIPIQHAPHMSMN